MRVSIIGAGPAGLYLAILLKKGDRDIEVSVVERNAPDATFGWGVVFSEETLGALRDADQETYLAITDTFARWDRVDIRYRGRVLRSQRALVLGDRAQAPAGDPPARAASPSGSISRSARRSTSEPDDADLVVGSRRRQQLRPADARARVRHLASSPKAASTSGSAPTSSSTPSPSSSARPSTGSSRCTPTRSTSARARSSSSARSRRGAAPGSTS